MSNFETVKFVRIKYIIMRCDVAWFGIFLFVFSSNIVPKFFVI